MELVRTVVVDTERAKLTIFASVTANGMLSLIVVEVSAKLSLIFSIYEFFKIVSFWLKNLHDFNSLSLVAAIATATFFYFTFLAH
jgi:hypothetical protein